MLEYARFRPPGLKVVDISVRIRHRMAQFISVYVCVCYVVKNKQLIFTDFGYETLSSNTEPLRVSFFNVPPIVFNDSLLIHNPKSSRDL